MSTSSRFAVAVHVLALMARSSDESLKSEQMAGSVNTNPVVVRRMLCELADGQLVVSYTGSAGGSRLARQPDQITLLDVYRAVDCQGGFSLHQHPNRRCPVGVSIGRVLEEVQGEIDSAIEQVLAQITLEDVVLRLTHHRPADLKSRRSEQRNDESNNGLNKPRRVGLRKYSRTK